jgi:DNA-binding MarR family transcriptional regulator
MRAARQGAGRPAARPRARRRKPELPRVDLGPLETSIGYRLRRAQLAVFEDAIRVFGEAGLRPGSFSVLLVIGRNPGLKQSDVCAALGIQRTNFVGLIDTLESRGLVARRRAANDGRSYALHLTAAGKRLVAHAMKLQRRHDAALARKLGPGGRDELLDLLGKLT